jgi:hypothetical protein
MRAASAFASSKVSPHITTSAPKPRVRSLLTVGVKRGITITAGMPSRCAWYANPCAWLPADTAITPCLRCASDNCASLFNAPRSLNDAVNCRFSNFRYTSAPVICDSVRECRHGVFSTWPASVAAAARMSPRVMGGWVKGRRLRFGRVAILVGPTLRPLGPYFLCLAKESRQRKASLRSRPLRGYPVLLATAGGQSGPTQGTLWPKAPAAAALLGDFEGKSTASRRGCRSPIGDAAAVRCGSGAVPGALSEARGAAPAAIGRVSRTARCCCAAQGQPRQRPASFGRLFFGDFLLAKQKKVTCRRATPGMPSGPSVRPQ